MHPFGSPSSVSSSNSPVYIDEYTFDEYVELARRFHTYPAPGVLIGGMMVAEAKRHMPEKVLYDAISETSWCLPDALQLLTPCSTGNGWMRVLDLGVYALSLFDKFTGEGVRVTINPEKLKPWPELAAWLLKTKPKQEQDSAEIRENIRTAGYSVLSVSPIKVRSPFLHKRSKGEIACCPLCGDAYPKRYGSICRSCQGESPYLEGPPVVSGPVSPALDGEDCRQPADAKAQLKVMRVEDSVGEKVLHDMTRIKPGESKGPEFLRGHAVSAGDVCRLQRMGRFNIYVEQDAPEGFVHEDDAARAFAESIAGTGVRLEGNPREGKVNLLADQDGLFLARRSLLEAFNLLPDVIISSRKGYSVVNPRPKDSSHTRHTPFSGQEHL